MNKNEEFFSPKHIRLLNIATWSKSLSWIVLAGFVLGAGAQFLQYQNLVNTYSQVQMNIWDFFKNNPMDAFRLGVNMADTALKGIVYFLVLKGISLGLNMIVETDINYREQGDAK